MTAVPPPAPAAQSSPPPPQTPVTPVTPVALVSNPPPALLQLPLGSRLEGLVLALAARGSAQVRTDAGTFEVQTPVPLAKGTPLALVLKALAPRVQVQIAAVGTPSPAPPFSGRSTPALQPPSPAPDRSLAAIAVGTRLTATLARPAPWLPGAAAKPFALGPVTAQPAPAQPTTAQPTTVSPPTTLPAGSRLTLRVVALQPATVALPTADAALFEPTALAAGRTLRGTVIGETRAGQPILRTAAGVFILSSTAALPRGTVLTLAITGSPSLPPAPPASAPTEVAAPVPGIPLPGEEGPGASRWRVLGEAVEALRTADPAAARQLVEAVLPRPDARLTTTVLFFLSALRGGDVRGWLGDGAVRALNRIRPDLSTRLGDDFRALARAADEPASGGWRVTQVPLFTGSEIELIRLWTRRHDDPAADEDDSRQRQDQRFIVDVSLSRLGRLQLDGLVRDAGRRLDLIVRSDSPLPPAMRDHIRGLFEDAGAFTGLIGGVGFQAAPAAFVDVAADSSGALYPGALYPGFVV